MEAEGEDGRVGAADRGERKETSRQWHARIVQRERGTEGEDIQQGR